jgi:DNA-binding transcriptional MerR regulator
LSRPARSNGGYRLYQEREIADLEFIQKAQQIGFSLQEIRELFSIQRHPQQVCEHVRDLIVQKLGLVRSKIDEMQRLEAGLADALKECRKSLRKPAHKDSCPVLQEINATQANRRKV